jgi:hypothetical protein
MTFRHAREAKAQQVQQLGVRAFRTGAVNTS